MKASSFQVLLAAGLWLAFVGQSPAQTDPSEPAGPTRIAVAYDDVANNASPTLHEARDVLISNTALEELGTLLSPLRLPRMLRIAASQCDAERRRYDPQTATVTICYEQVAKILEVAQAHFEPGTHEKLYFITGATIATLLHETSYGLFDTLDIPIWGRLEDAADRLSAFLMVQFGEDIARSAFSGFTNYLIWTHVTPTDTDLQATLPPQMQRYYNVACILVVGNPVDVIPVADEMPEGLFAPSRFGRCGAEYEQIRQAFNLRVMPYVDPDKLIAIRAAKWCAVC